MMRHTLKKSALLGFCSLALFNCVTVQTSPKDVAQKQPEEIENPYFGDYATDRIRGMWGICFVSSTSKNPMVPPPLHAIYCDCMVDKVRGRYSQKYLTAIDSTTELNDIMIRIAQECVDEVIHPVYPQEPKPESTTWNYQN